jgi:hypothetical protein
MREMMGREPGSSGLRVRRLILSFVVPALLLPLVVFSSCEDSGSNPSRDAVLQGQVFLISKPGPIPIGWVPPPLETVSTVLVLNTQRIVVKEASTDSKCRFSISIAPGTYYLRVKESPIPAETGPYAIPAGETRTAEAHYDNGMR